MSALTVAPFSTDELLGLCGTDAYVACDADRRRVQMWVPLPDPLPTVNGERRRPWQEHRVRTAADRQTVALLAGAQAKLKRLSPVVVVAVPVQRKPPLADPGGHYPVVKSVIDGLVDADVLVGDTGQHVVELRLRPPIIGPTAGLFLHIQEDPHHDD